MEFVARLAAMAPLYSAKSSKAEAFINVVGKGKARKQENIINSYQWGCMLIVTGYRAPTSRGGRKD